MKVVEIEAKELNFGFLRADQEHSMNSNVYILNSDKTPAVSVTGASENTNSLTFKNPVSCSGQNLTVPLPTSLSLRTLHTLWSVTLQTQKLFFFFL